MSTILGLTIKSQMQWTTIILTPYCQFLFLSFFSFHSVSHCGNPTQLRPLNLFNFFYNAILGLTIKSKLQWTTIVLTPYCQLLILSFFLFILFHSVAIPHNWYRCKKIKTISVPSLDQVPVATDHHYLLSINLTLFCTCFICCQLLFFLLFFFIFFFFFILFHSVAIPHNWYPFKKKGKKVLSSDWSSSPNCNIPPLSSIYKPHSNFFFGPICNIKSPTK